MPGEARSRATTVDLPTPDGPESTTSRLTAVPAGGSSLVRELRDQSLNLLGAKTAHTAGLSDL